MKTVGCTPIGTIKWSGNNYMTIGYPQHPGGCPYMVKKITVHIEFPSYEEMNKWYNEEALRDWENMTLRTTEEFRCLAVAFNQGCEQLRNGEKSIKVDYSTFGGIYRFDTKGNIRPTMYFVKHVAGDFNKFYKQ